MPVENALELLIQQYGKLVFHTIYGLTGNWEESQDLTQDTFQQALQGLDAAQKSSGADFHAKAWLLRIALNTVRMQRRRRRLYSFIPFSRMHEEREQEYTTLHEQATPVQPTGYGVIAQRDPAEVVAERDAVQRTMAKLSEPLRVCLLLAIVSGLSTAEIADMLGMKEAAVRQRLARARKQFQQIYAYESGETVYDADTSLHTLPEQQAHAEEPSEQRASRLPLALHPSSLWSNYAQRLS